MFNVKYDEVRESMTLSIFHPSESFSESLRLKQQGYSIYKMFLLKF